MTIFKIGTDERPATQEDVDAFRNELNAAIMQGRSIVCHHAVDVMTIPDPIPTAIVPAQLVNGVYVPPPQIPTAGWQQQVIAGISGHSGFSHSGISNPDAFVPPVPAPSPASHEPIDEDEIRWSI